jgi:hypothetical protein
MSARSASASNAVISGEIAVLGAVRIETCEYGGMPLGRGGWFAGLLVLHIQRIFLHIGVLPVN